MEQNDQKMSSTMEDSSSIPSPANKSRPIESDGIRPVFRPGRDSDDQQPRRRGGRFRRLLARVFCRRSHRRRRRREKLEAEFEFFEGKVADLQYSNRTLAATHRFLSVKSQALANERNWDALSMETMHWELDRLSSSNSRVKELNDYIDHQLDHKVYYVDHLKLSIKTMDREISDLKSLQEESFKANNENLKAIEELKKKLTEMRSKKDKEGGRPENEKEESCTDVKFC